MASGRLIVPLAEPILNSSGLVEPGTTMTVYVTGTSLGTKASLYSDPGLTTPIANPQTADAAGRFYVQATVWWVDSSQAYDVQLLLPDGESFTFTQLYVLGAATNTSGFAPINSPAFTGVPTAPTPASNDNTGKIATTAFVKNQNYAPLNSPALTGTPTTPTAGAGTNTTQIASTAYALAAAAGTISALASGYQKFASGLILQWGFKSVSLGHGTTSTVTWPIAFPNNCYAAVGTMQNAGGDNSSPQGLQLNATPGLSSATFISIGYSSGAFTNCTGFFWLAVGN